MGLYGDSVRYETSDQEDVTALLAEMDWEAKEADVVISETDAQLALTAQLAVALRFPTILLEEKFPTTLLEDILPTKLLEVI